MLRPQVIGCDPAISHFGVATLGISTSQSWRVFSTDVLTTAKSAKKRRAREADEQSRRIHEISAWLWDYIRKARERAPVLALAVEAGAIPYRNGQPLFTPTTISSLGRARGLVDGIAACLDLPVIDVTPQEVKRLATGKDKGTKEQVRACLEQLYPGVSGLWPEKLTLVEHAADALAVATVAARGDFCRSVLGSWYSERRYGT